MLLCDAEESVPEINHTTGWLQCFEARKVVCNFGQIGDEHKSAQCWSVEAITVTTVCSFSSSWSAYADNATSGGRCSRLCTR